MDESLAEILHQKIIHNYYLTLENESKSQIFEFEQDMGKGVFNNYDKDRDYPYLDKTTKLSAYIKFGCLSIREIYYTLPITHGIIRELFWHDFYANITYEFPRVLQGQLKGKNKSYKEKFLILNRVG